MSARALLAGDLQLVEVPMPYAERAGESKLSVVRDGFRFLRAILDATLLYRPARLLEPLAVATAAAAVLLMATPLLAYLRERAVADWMIYRFLVSQLLGTLAFLLLGANYLSGRIVGLWRGKPARPSPLARGFAWLLRGAPGWTLVAALLVAAFALVAHGLWELFATGHVVLHWSRFVAMAFLAQIAALTLLFKGIGYGLDLVAREQRPGGRW
jgi:hypothetical protein